VGRDSRALLGCRAVGANRSLLIRSASLAGPWTLTAAIGAWRSCVLRSYRLWLGYSDLQTRCGATCLLAFRSAPQDFAPTYTVLVKTFPGDCQRHRHRRGCHGTHAVGAALVFAGVGSMAAAAVVLLLSSPDKAGAALTQGAFPLIAIVLLVLGLIS
jgi:hypothetical protein